MTDDDEVDNLLKSEARRQRLERLGVLAMVLGLVIGGIGLAIARSSGPGDGAVDAIWMGAVGVSITAAIATLFVRPGKDAKRLESLIGRRDRMQRARNDRVYALSITAWGLLAIALGPLMRIAQDQGEGSDLRLAATLPLAAFLIVLFMGGWDGFGNSWARQNRKWLEDEFTRAMRGRAMALGFPVLMGGVGVAYLLGLWRPEWALVAMPVVLIGAASAVGLRFAWLDRQAEGGDD
jgi:hypothetical protein